MSTRPERGTSRTFHLVQSGGEAAPGSSIDFQLIVEQSPSLVLVTDSAGRVEYVNPRFCEVTGYSADEVVGKQIHELGELSSEQAGEIWMTVSTGRTWRGEFQAPKKSGESYWVSSCISPVVSPGGIVSQFVSTNIDITDTKRAEEELRESEGRFRALAETTTAAAFIFDGARVIYANPAAAAVTGYASGELEGMNFWEIIHPDVQDGVNEVARARSTGDTRPVEVKLRRKDGELRWLEFSTGFVEYDGARRVLGTAFDITDRKAAEEALNQSQERLRRALDRGQMTAWEWDIENDRITDTAGEGGPLAPDPEPQTYGRFLEAVCEEDRDEVAEALRRAVEEEGEFAVEFRMLWPDGRVHWVVTSGGLMVDEDGRRKKLVGVAMDITERKEVEDAVRQSEEKLRYLLNNAPLVLSAWDADGNYTIFEGKGMDGFHMQPEDIVGRHITEVFPGAGVWEGFERAKQGTMIVDEVLVGGRWWTSTSLPLRDGQGEATGVIGVSVDITARKGAEGALRESEERYRTLYQDNPSMYFTVAEEGTVLSVNQFGAEQLGYSPEELVGASVFEVFHKADRAAVRRQFDFLARDPSQVRSWEFRKVRKDGEVIWVREIVRATQDAAGETIFLVVCEDISERRSMEDAMQSMREELERRAERAVAQGSRYSLSFREMTVVELVASGKSDKEIGVVLGIRPMTVSKHVANVLKKMGAASRAEAGVRALREGIIN